MHSTFKRFVYRGLVALQAPRVLARLHRGALILCFHNVVPDDQAGVGDASLHMPVGVFEAIARWMATTYEVVPLGEVVERASAMKSVAGLAALTFDDAYLGVFDHALPVLEAASLPSTLFVVSGFAQVPAPTWWDTLAAHGLLTDERREVALFRQRGLREEVLAAEDAPGRGPRLPEVLLPATWERIAHAVGDLVALGSHTAQHPNLTALSDEELEDELSRSRREILERTDREPGAVAYPYGLWEPRVARAAARAGYRMGLTLEGSPAGTGRDLMSTPRLNVPSGISPEALECWASGIRLRKPW